MTKLGERLIKSAKEGGEMAKITDEVCMAALRGWCNYPPNADLSKVQTAPETMEAWRRAIAAALVALDK